MHQEYDIIVVGGGPAGSTAAYLLANKGWKVCIVEKQAFPREKLCAGLLTWKTINLLSNLLQVSVEELWAKGLLTYSCKDYRLYFKEHLITEGCLDYPFHFIERQSYDHFWLELARSAGATILVPHRVSRVDAEKGQVSLANGNSLRGSLIIGADGIWSVCRKTNMKGIHGKPWNRNLGKTIESRFPYLDHKRTINKASLYFGYVPWGYAWSFPSATHHIIGMVSCASPHRANLKNGFREFQYIIPKNSKNQALLGSHPLPYGCWIDPPGSCRLILVGDACGLADPLLGEGIYYAHFSALLAAMAINTSPMCEIEIQRTYRKLLNRHIFKDFRWIRFYRNLIFWGGRHRHYRGIRMAMALFPKFVETLVQGQRSFARPWKIRKSVMDEVTLSTQ